AGEEVGEILGDFVRPFDLGIAPLLRVSLVKLPQDKYLLFLDTHHIISDGVSHGILVNEFSRLYDEEEVPGLKLHYRDYAEWENRMFLSGQLKKQEEYWLRQFNSDIPVLNLPVNYPRPTEQSFEGDIDVFHLEKETTGRLKQLVKETDTTLYIVLLAVYNIILHKYTGREDIVIGSILAGRNRVDFENVVGMFVKTLALRNRPIPHKTFDIFLQEVKDNTLAAFENQDYPFSHLVNKLNLTKDRNRNPLFDAAFILQSKMTVGERIDLDAMPKLSDYGFQNKTAKFDLLFEASETLEGIALCFQYSSQLFKPETIQLLKERFLVLLNSILDRPLATLEDLHYTVPMEREMVKAEEVEFDF
ncbi:MAG: non-ribosomal peptide synthetase, partial [bacterium]|nr:non-ribosomal peptide synthetase [bacterium]